MPDPIPAPPANPMGGIIRDLPIASMVAAPVMAAVDAQFAIAMKTAEFIDTVGLNPDKSVKMVRMSYSQAETDQAGAPTGKTIQRVIDVPFLTLVPMPNMEVQGVKVNFDLEVSTAEENKSSSEYSASISGSVGFAWWKVQFSGSISHKSEQTRKTDTRAKYSFEVTVGKGETPEGLSRVFEALLAGVTKPVDKDKAPALPAPVAAK